MDFVGVASWFILFCFNMLVPMVTARRLGVSSTVRSGQTLWVAVPVIVFVYIREGRQFSWIFSSQRLPHRCAIFPDDSLSIYIYI